MGGSTSPRIGWRKAALEAVERIRLPSQSVLPVAGAVVGLYGGLAAGVFANLLGLVSGVALAPVRLVEAFRTGSETPRVLAEELAEASWHPEYLLVGLPLAFGALGLARMIEPGEERDDVRKRLRVLALLVLGALALYYPLVGLSVLNAVFGQSHDLVGVLMHLPWWAMLAAPALGGLLVGHLLRNYPEVHGHGVPEVVRAVNTRAGIRARRGVLKLIASAITIGSGGSGGREGPIVFAGAAIASSVGKTLGFTRKELSILLASGAGAGIAASFNAPIAGAVFAMEIILREFELRVLSPIILASVTATLVARGILGGTQVLQRVPYQLVSGYEILIYALLGLAIGVVIFLFIRMLHGSERFFAGQSELKGTARLSRWLGSRTLAVRAGLGGLAVGGLAMVNPAVWGTGHEFMNLAIAGKLGLLFLATAGVLKAVSTSLTIGSGGSGGTFFPAAMIGAMAGGLFGELAHRAFPLTTAPSGAYALVGIGGAVAALNRGPLTGLMMLYELSANSAIILPLMVTCTIASALCHALTERRSPKRVNVEELLSDTQVRILARKVDPISAELPFDALSEQLIAAEDGVLPVATETGRVIGVVQMNALRRVWSGKPPPTGTETGELAPTPPSAGELARLVEAIEEENDVQYALQRMDAEDLDALPVRSARSGMTYGLVTRSAVRRLIHSARGVHASGLHQAVAPTELSPVPK